MLQSNSRNTFQKYCFYTFVFPIELPLPPAEKERKKKLCQFTPNKINSNSVCGLGLTIIYRIQYTNVIEGLLISAGVLGLGFTNYLKCNCENNLQSLIILRVFFFPGSP